MHTPAHKNNANPPSQSSEDSLQGYALRILIGLPANRSAELALAAPFTEQALEDVLDSARDLVNGEGETLKVITIAMDENGETHCHLVFDPPTLN